MKLSRKPSPTESALLFEMDNEPLEETLTAWGGAPLVVQALRSLGVPSSVRQHVRIKQRERGYDEATMVESFVVPNAVGGECPDDFQHLRDDAGLKEMLGHEIPSPESARQFLNRFHSQEKLEQARDGRAGADRFHSGRGRCAERVGRGESGVGAGAWPPLRGSAHRDGGSGCDDHRKP